MTDIDTAALREEWHEAASTTDTEPLYHWGGEYGPALLDEVDRLRAALARLRAMCGDDLGPGAWPDGLVDLTNRVQRETGRSLWPSTVRAVLLAALTPDTKEADRG